MASTGKCVCRRALATPGVEVKLPTAESESSLSEVK